MNIAVTQCYTHPDARLPFSHFTQRHLKSELSQLVEASAAFQKQYGTEYGLWFFMDAARGIADNVVKGPGRYKKGRAVEFAVTLPYDVIIRATDGPRIALEFLIAGIRDVLASFGMDTSKLDENKKAIIERICSDPTMLRAPWPQRPPSALH